MWLRELDEELAHKLKEGVLGLAYLEAGGVVPAIDDLSGLEQLAQDYCQLFIGPSGHLPPYQSVWQHGRMNNGSAVSMANYVETVGYQIPTQLGNVMLDHLGLQLDVMGWCIRCQSQQQDAYERDKWSEVTACFFQDHLAWPDQLLRKAQGRAETTFYRKVAKVTEEFLGSEREIRGQL